MKSRAMLIVLAILAFGTATVWARGFGSSMGGGRSFAGTGIRSGAGRPTAVFSTRPFVGRVRPVFIHVPNHFFPFHRHFFRYPGLVVGGVPLFVGTAVTTTEFVPGYAWAPGYFVETMPADSRLRGPGQLAPFDPAPQDVVERMLALAGTKSGDVVYDLGSGDGRVVITAAKKYSVKGVGFEIDPGLVKLARENVRKEGVGKLVEIRQQDFMTADLSPATVVTLYLSYDGNLALRPRLMSQLKPGARVVSNTFDMGDWQAKIVETYRDASGDTHLLYYWEIGAPENYSNNSR